MRFILTPIAAAITISLVGCGGGVDSQLPEAPAVAISAPAMAAAGNADEGMAVAQPAFHRMGYQLNAPNTNGIQQRVPSELALDTALAIEDDAALLKRMATRKSSASTAATTSVMVVHTPADIRRAYGMPSLSKATPEDLGAGQTIYIIGAYNNPNLLSDLAAFNSSFGLPQCTEVKIPVNSYDALPPAPTDKCTISVVYGDMYRTLMKETPPVYNRTWAVESALDVQWAHATAPLARIVVIESLNNFVNSFADGLKLANRLGPGVVSMSWVAGELPTYTEKYETFFRGTGMTYFAAAGDFGTQANWPATSPSVIAVAGTSLKVTATGRTETAWSKSGAGYSAYFKAPAYQTSLSGPAGVTGRYSTTPGVRARASGDVAFNADPLTGQYVYFTPKGGVGSWYSYGGTSIGTPQWAGITAAANAHRAKAGLGTLGKFHDRLYTYYGPSIGGYVGTFSDVSVGANGTASWCNSTYGWDVPTGWGTPNVSQLLGALSR